MILSTTSQTLLQALTGSTKSVSAIKKSPWSVRRSRRPHALKMQS